MRIQVKISDFRSEAEIGIGFLGELIEQTDLSIDEIYEKLQKNPFKMAPELLYIALKYTAEEDDREFTLSKRDLIRIIDKDGGHKSPGLMKFLKGFYKSLTEGVPEEEGENVQSNDPQEAKKK